MTDIVVRLRDNWATSAEAHEAADEIKKLRECMSLLYSVQNGCPLDKYEKDWNEAMDTAAKLLGYGDRQ